MVVDWNIRFGDILVMGTLICSALVYAFRAGGVAERIEVMTNGLDELKRGYKEVADLLVQVAVQQNRLDTQDERINRLSAWIDDLRRGQGFIVDRRVPPS